MVGWVYAFATPSMPGIVKIGATNRDPAERLREANADTWHMHEYVVACVAEVADAFAVERAVHVTLAARRVHPRREFFQVTEAEARTLLSFFAPAPVGTVEGRDNALARAAAPAAPAAAPFSSQRASVRLRRGAMGPTDATALRAWVEENYAHVTLREKSAGTKLDTLYTGYTSVVPPVHTKVLGKILFFAKMLESRSWAPRAGRDERAALGAVFKAHSIACHQ